MKQTLYEYCIQFAKTDLLEEWDMERNAPAAPWTLTSGSSKKVWWKCKKGHRWMADTYSRAKLGSRCPVCSGRRLLAGVNDLATVNPQLAAQWHPSKNDGLTPDQIMGYSHRAVWWLCNKGHTWRASIHSRSRGTGCPVCAGRSIVKGVNDLATQMPLLAAQWHPSKNGHLSPEDVVCGSSRKVWWQCSKGHEWEASISSRARGGTGCPVCTGKRVLSGENDLATIFPEIASQWDREKNEAMSPAQISPYSNRQVWWRCALGHSYRAAVGSRTNGGSGCPYCAGVKVLQGFNDLSTIEPKVAAQWHPTLNGALMPTMVTTGSRKKVWWECDLGHVWQAVISSRTGTQRSGCPVCAGRVKQHHLTRHI